MADKDNQMRADRIRELRKKLSTPERMDGDDWSDVAAALDELAEARPLLERIMGATIVRKVGGWDGFLYGDLILSDAIDYRNRKGEVK